MGKYVDSNLLPGESVITEGRIHWAIYIGPAVLIVVGLLFSGPISTVFILLGVVGLGLRFLQASTTELALTNKRVIAKGGIISRHSLDLSLSKVEGVNFNQGIIGRMLGYGSIAVRGTGGNHAPVPFITQPEVFKNEVGRVLHA